MEIQRLFPTNINKIDSLLSPAIWKSGPTEPTLKLSYSFIESTSTFDTGYGGGDTNPARTVSTFSNVDREFVRALFSKLESIVNIKFQEIVETGNRQGTLRFGYSGSLPEGASGGAFGPGRFEWSGDVWISSELRTVTTSDQMSFKRHVFLHETLHALGLSHPFESSLPGSTATLPASENHLGNTVMAYNVFPNEARRYLSYWPDEPMPLDITVLQYLYGPADSSLVSDRYDVSSATFLDRYRVIWDNGGVDLVDATGSSYPVKIDLSGDDWSDIGGRISSRSNQSTMTLYIPAAAKIEDVRGSAFADVLKGNSLNNRMQGGIGDDLIFGADGIDTAVFTGSRNTYSIRRDGQNLVVSGHSGSDGVDTLVGIERLEFSDLRLAFDTEGPAGKVAKLLGALFGKALINDPQAMGIGLTLADQGLSEQELASAAIAARGITNPTSAVRLMWENIFGVPPTTAQEEPFLSAIISGKLGLVDLVLLAANSQQNQEQIQIVGLSETGIAFT